MIPIAIATIDKHGEGRHRVPLSDRIPHGFPQFLASMNTSMTASGFTSQFTRVGVTTAYETLQRIVSEIVEFYQSEELIETISSVAGETVLPTPSHDQSACSILISKRVHARLTYP